MFFIFILIAVFGCFLYYCFTRSFNYWKYKNVVGPKPIPFFGNLKESALRRKHVGIIYKEIYDEFPNESVIGIYRMTSPTLIIRDLDIVKQILIKDFDYFPERGIEFSKEGLGDNLFHCDGNTWHALRNKLTPLFTSGKLRNTFRVIDNCADQLVKHLEDVTIGDNEQETNKIFQKYTMESIIGTMFGLDFNLYNDNHGIIQQAGNDIFKSTYGAEVDMLFPNILKKVNVSLYLESVNRFSYEVMKMVVNERKGVPANKNDLLDVLLTLKKDSEVQGVKRFSNNDVSRLKMTDHVMAGQVFIFFAAGFGNNTLSLSYALFYLAKNQNIQDTCIREIDDVMTKYDGKITYDAIKEMTYLDKVFSEILRIHTLTNSIQRSAKKDYKIPGTDVVVDKGTTVIISPYAIHRDEKLYPDPDNFDPERFSPENSAQRHPCAYLPFGTGPRSCLGRQLAKIQFIAAIAKIFSKFRVMPSKKTFKVEDYEPMSTLLATRGGIYVNFILR